MVTTKIYLQYEHSKWVFWLEMSFTNYRCLLVATYKIFQLTSHFLYLLISVCEPSLSLPLTIGLYAKWGSGKSILLSKLKESMHSFSRSWLEGASLRSFWRLAFSLCSLFFRLSFLTFFKMLVVCVLCTLVLTTISAILRSIPLYITIWIVGILLYVALTATLSKLFHYIFEL